MRESSFKKQANYRWLKITIWTILAVILLFVLFYALVHPVLGLFIDPGYCEGIEFFEQEVYTKNKYGDKFKEYIDTVGVLPKGEVVNFYYADNHRYDNPFYGKIPDVMAIDVRLDSQEYEKIEKNTLDYQTSELFDNENFELYIPNDIAGKDHLILYALNDEEKIFRAIMITDTEDFEDESNIFHVLTRWCTLSF